MRLTRLRSNPTLLVALTAVAAALTLVCTGAAADDAVKLTAPTSKQKGALPGVAIQAPHYGDTLFHFYQGRYFTSLTQLMASQHFQRVAQHGDEAEVLRGGLLLSYGLHREAGEIFARLIERGAPAEVRDRAWYYLAKIRYQRGLPGEAEAALGRIQNKLPGELEDERGLLQANLLLARADYAGASALLTRMTAAPAPAAAAEGSSNAGSASAREYARFNLGVALVRGGDAARGSAVLDELGRAGAPNEELRTLRDKANVALGFAALSDNRPADARVALERVRLTSLHANKALLGFGWAAAALKAPAQALVPWTELSQRDASDAAVLEARIAVPYAYAEMGAYGQSLARYNEAIADFDREGSALNESIAAIRDGRLLGGLLERNPGEEMGWFWSLGELPEMPHAGHLTQVLAQHEFQEAFKNFRDLLFLARNLQNWQDNLGVYGDMLVNRRQAYAERLPQVLARASVIVLKPLESKGGQLARELAEAESKRDGVAFANPKERDLMARLAAVQAGLKDGALAPEEIEAKRERARLAAGVLAWNLSQQYPERVWQATKNLRRIEHDLVQARDHEAALVRAQREEPARHADFAKRIAALDKQVRALTPQVAALVREQQGAVQEIAVAALEGQKERLATYATQARFAVAQLHDKAQGKLNEPKPAGPTSGDKPQDQAQVLGATINAGDGRAPRQ